MRCWSGVGMRLNYHRIIMWGFLIIHWYLNRGLSVGIWIWLLRCLIKRICYWCKMTLTQRATTSGFILKFPTQPRVALFLSKLPTMYWCNQTKSKSLFSNGMKISAYSEKMLYYKGLKWTKACDNIKYYKNDYLRVCLLDRKKKSYTLWSSHIRSNTTATQSTLHTQCHIHILIWKIISQKLNQITKERSPHNM